MYFLIEGHSRCAQTPWAETLDVMRRINRIMYVEHADTSSHLGLVTMTGALTDFAMHRSQVLDRCPTHRRIRHTDMFIKRLRLLFRDDT